MRADIADIRLADRVFAPHYAAPLPRETAVASALTATKDGETVGQVAAGEIFEILEMTATHAWGVAADGKVGFLPIAALK